MAVARDHQALERPVPLGLDRRRHRCRGLARAQHDGAPGGALRQEARHRVGRIGGLQGGAKQRQQQIGGVKIGLDVLFAAHAAFVASRGSFSKRLSSKAKTRKPMRTEKASPKASAL